MLDEFEKPQRARGVEVELRPRARELDGESRDRKGWIHQPAIEASRRRVPICTMRLHKRIRHFLGQMQAKELTWSLSLLPNSCC